MNNYLIREQDLIDCPGSDSIINFYDERYRDGYMDEWPIDKKQRILELIKELNLPETGDALDFGCGNGEFTGVLKQALPKWNIYGGDISSIAINNARKRHPDCLFFLARGTHFASKKFDFLFSHHVLEHVNDISESWCEISQYLKEQSSMLHILPCGNPGSFEYTLCMQRINGVDSEAQGRFVFEDESHLRRLTTKEMDGFALRYNFKPVLGYYSNQFYGALDWITLLNPFLIADIVNPKKAKTNKATLRLAFLCFVLVLVRLMRFPANTIDYKKTKMKKTHYFCLFLILFIFYPLSKMLNIYLKYLSSLEWKKDRTKNNGSEMYLYYNRV